MAAPSAPERSVTVAGVVLRALIVALAFGTAFIHSTLGGPLFTMNALGYVVLGVAMVVPLALAVRLRWLIRFAVAGYALTTIVAWAIQGPYFSTAYLAKAIEVALIVTVAVDFLRADGDPVRVLRTELAAFRAIVRRRPAPDAVQA
jgi:hypothetical protein